MSNMSKTTPSDSPNVILDVNFINPFLAATENVLTTMPGISVARQKPLRALGTMPTGDLAGILPMKTERITGQFIISFPKSTILKITNELLRENYTDLNEQVIDSVGEFTNMITGGAKATMCEVHNFDMARPTMILKEEFNKLDLVAPIQITIPYKSSVGSFYIEIGFVSL